MRMLRRNLIGFSPARYHVDYRASPCLHVSVVNSLPRKSFPKNLQSESDVHT